MYINGVLVIELIKGQLTDNNEYNGAYIILKDKDTIPYAPSVKVFCDILYSNVISRVFSSPPQRPMTSDFEGFLYQILSITLFSYLDS